MKAAGIVTFGTDLVNPDFAAVATAIGMFGRRVEQPGDLDAALTEAFAHDGPALVDLGTARQELSIAAAGDHDRTGEGLVAVRNPDHPGRPRRGTSGLVSANVARRILD